MARFNITLSNDGTLVFQDTGKKAGSRLYEQAALSYFTGAPFHGLLKNNGIVFDANTNQVTVRVNQLEHYNTLYDFISNLEKEDLDPSSREKLNSTLDDRRSEVFAFDATFNPRTRAFTIYANPIVTDDKTISAKANLLLGNFFDQLDPGSNQLRATVTLQNEADKIAAATMMEAATIVAVDVAPRIYGAAELLRNILNLNFGSSSTLAPVTVSKTETKYHYEAQFNPKNKMFTLIQVNPDKEVIGPHWRLNVYGLENDYNAGNVPTARIDDPDKVTRLQALLTEHNSLIKNADAVLLALKTFKPSPSGSSSNSNSRW